jgi:hypothetical protein
MTANEMWNMRLFEEENIKTSHGGDWIVIRVPGGWIMRETHIPSPAYVFIPLNNEFI